MEIGPSGVYPEARRADPAVSAAFLLNVFRMVPIEQQMASVRMFWHKLPVSVQQEICEHAVIACIPESEATNGHAAVAV